HLLCGCQKVRFSVQQQFQSMCTGFSFNRERRIFWLTIDFCNRWPTGSGWCSWRLLLLLFVLVSFFGVFTGVYDCRFYRQMKRSATPVVRYRYLGLEF